MPAGADEAPLDVGGALAAGEEDGRFELKAGSEVAAGVPERPTVGEEPGRLDEVKLLGEICALEAIGVEGTAVVLAIEVAGGTVVKAVVAEVYNRT